jgi:hypothetical protein
MVGVTDRPGMLTPPGPLIPYMIYSEVPCLPHSLICISYRFMKLISVIHAILYRQIFEKPFHSETYIFCNSSIMIRLLVFTSTYMSWRMKLSSPFLIKHMNCVNVRNEQDVLVKHSNKFHWQRYHLIFHVTSFSIGWKIGWVFVSIDLKHHRILKCHRIYSA